MTIQTNGDHLVRVAVEGQVAPQEFEFGWTTPYLISNEGVPRVVPGTGGITNNVRVGDRIQGLVDGQGRFYGGDADPAIDGLRSAAGIERASPAS